MAYLATAENMFSHIRFLNPVDQYLPLTNSPKIGPDACTPAIERRPSDNRSDMLDGPIPISASWLGLVERRIRDSICPDEVEYINDGRWLSVDVALHAMNFFQNTSDVLPGEPYIYSSTRGDLVAEFKASCGSMTGIVGTNSVIAFAVVGDTIIKKENLELSNDKLAETRQELQRLTEKLNTV